jgi:acetyl-CoA C-acetyltransferase
MMALNKPSADDVVVAGVGMTPVREYWDISLRELALRSITEARQAAPTLRPEALFVANMLAPALSAQTHLGALIADFAGLRGIEAVTIEAAGASGGAAIRQAFLALKSGSVQSVLVVGIEKVTDKVGAFVDAALATGTDADYEAIQGITLTTQAAMLMRRYLHEHNAPDDALSGFSINAHTNAVTNPNAMFRRAIGLEQYQNAPMISPPVNMYDAAPLADGAASILLTRRELLSNNSQQPRIRIAASTLTTSALAVHDRPDPLSLRAAKQCVENALNMAGIGLEQIDFFELHDQFSILAALSLEAAGFAERGKGWEMAQNGDIQLQGKIPISTFGGSKARGDIGGATGVFQAIEVVRQLQAEAQENQVTNAQIGMSQCLGGMGSTVATHIFASDG